MDALENMNIRDTYPRAHAVIQLWMYPAFSDFVSWTVFADKDHTNPIVKQVIWNKLFDIQRFTDPLEGLKKGWHTAPIMSVEEALLRSDEFAARLKNGQSIRVALLTEKSPWGLDGTSYGLWYKHFYADFRLKWWADGPQEWRELTTWASDMRTYLSQAFACE